EDREPDGAWSQCDQELVVDAVGLELYLADSPDPRGGRNRHGAGDTSRLADSRDPRSSYRHRQALKEALDLPPGCLLRDVHPRNTAARPALYPVFRSAGYWHPSLAAHGGGDRHRRALQRLYGGSLSRRHRQY